MIRRTIHANNTDVIKYIWPHIVQTKFVLNRLGKRGTGNYIETLRMHEAGCFSEHFQSPRMRNSVLQPTGNLYHCHNFCRMRIGWYNLHSNFSQREHVRGYPLLLIYPSFFYRWKKHARTARERRTIPFRGRGTGSCLYRLATWAFIHLACI